MSSIAFGCLPTAIGSMPHTDPAAACAQLTHYLKDIPAWPQLPKRSFLENMYVQYSDGLPGVVVENEKIFVDRSRNSDSAIEKLYTAYVANDIDRYPVTQAYAAGLHQFLNLSNLSPLAVKGQITGPISFGLTVCDSDKKPILYDDIFADLAARLLRLKAAWQEKELRKLSRNTIIFIDEPYLASFGSAYVSLSREKVTALLEEVLGGISGLKGVHCCGNTDWPVLLETSIDILSFDSYNYAQSLSLYPAETKRFLDRGGTIAWGIVPNNNEALAGESVSSLQDRLEEAMAPFTRKGIPFRQLVRQGLLTPSCSLTPLAGEEAAAQALALLAELSIKIRKRYSFT